MTGTAPVLHAALQQTNLGDAYRSVYDLLATAYWETSDLANKDLVFGAREAVGEIIDAIDQQELADNTAIINALLPKLKAANSALEEIRSKINQITRNLNTAATVVAAITQVLSLVPKL